MNRRIIAKGHPDDLVVALAGNPNVGKSTVFNALTGLHQHTGNWSGKTVATAQGYMEYRGQGFTLIDLPGCYSLTSHSAEEEVARDFICFGKPDAIIVICDAICLERNLNLVLQILEITSRVIVCVNLIDEAEKKHVSVNLKLLAEHLGVPVVATAARSNRGLDELMDTVHAWIQKATPRQPLYPIYPEFLETALASLGSVLEPAISSDYNARWLALKLLENDVNLLNTLREDLLPHNVFENRYRDVLQNIKHAWLVEGIYEQQIRDAIVRALIQRAEEISHLTVTYVDPAYSRADRKLDRLLTSSRTGVPIMMCVLMLVFWITISGVNYPSQLLSAIFTRVEAHMLWIFLHLGLPAALTDMLVFGLYRVLAWVVAVMLPPMAIFFPLFTLLEDSGYLPRIAFNLDKVYKHCSACGKQALTMCMGFGCNAAGVVGCRIIDSPRERLIAILTNNFVPCNGRFTPPRLE